MKQVSDSICSEFETQFRSDQDPRIEDFLSRVDEKAVPSVLPELVCLEIELRNSTGKQSVTDEYINRFPDFSDLVRKALNRLDEQGSNDLEAFEAVQTFAIPKKIDRYEISKRLGGGAFGEVYLADDTQLDRQVALKFARQDRFQTTDEIRKFIEEAKTAAQVDHPAIVSIFDVRQDDKLVFIVQQYVEGENLRAELNKGRLSSQRIAEIISNVAEAIGCAHQNGIVHRDLKPANILLDTNGNPFVSDFGLAIHESFQRKLRGECAGTPSFMSPEQVRGETHRLDGRSDIWSLGVMLFHMLTGRMPFQGDDFQGLFDEILNREPTPIRQINPDSPQELERICQKCLSKRIADRYVTAEDLASDLKHWLQSLSSIEQEKQPDEPPVVPRGLRSFNDQDADFFLKLIPGPRDRNGFPESVGFWKSRIEETKEDKTFSVGLIYGPSGCGKSSLIKAGILPRINPNVVCFYNDCTPTNTELRLLTSLRKHFPEIPPSYSLPGVLEGIREGLWLSPGRKLLIVFDQFEQWLQSQQANQPSELVDALRQCDGIRVQCLLAVRDDFWLATSRCMRELEIEMVEGSNTAMVDLFDPIHASYVLGEFGRAYGRLPFKAPFTIEQTEFLESAIEELAVDGKLICVHIALFAQMFKGKDWNQHVLKKSGGAEGVGVAFLNESFSDKHAPQKNRFHEIAARAVLGHLLPESRKGIRGRMRSYDEMLSVSGYSDKQELFDDLINILDQDLRLITSTDPLGENSEVDQKDSTTKLPSYYQITHDFLVHPLRRWLTQKQKESIRGRAELRLSDLAGDYELRPGKRSLPAVWEFLNIKLLTDRRQWSGPQQEMMRMAGRYYGVRLFTVAVLITVSIFAVQQLIGRLSASSLVSRLLEVETANVPELVEQMEPIRHWVDPLLDVAANDGQLISDLKKRLHISLALFPVKQDENEFLYQQLLTDSNPNGPASIAKVVGRNSEIVNLWEQKFNLLLTEYQPGISDSEACKKLAIVGAALVAMNRSERVLPLLRFSKDPTVRSYLIEWFHRFDVDSAFLQRALQQPYDPGIRSALLLSLGNYISDFESSANIYDQVIEICRGEQNPAVIASGEWLLRRLESNVPIGEIRRKLATDNSQRSRKWVFNKLGQMMVHLDTSGQIKNAANSQTIKLMQSFYISNTEVTIEQFRKCFPDFKLEEELSPSVECPVTQVTWFQAAEFCNYLSKLEGIGKQHWCYIPNKDGEYAAGMKIVSNLEDREGYRLPTEAEWKHACDVKLLRQAWNFGIAKELMPHYAWFGNNSGAQEQLAIVGLLKPNQYGIFDMHGNAEEMTQDQRQNGTKNLPINAGSYFICKGGNSSSPADNTTTDALSQAKASQPYTRIGFRVVKISK